MTNPNSTRLLSPAGQLKRATRIKMPEYHRSMTDLRDAVVQALGKDARVCALASEDYCEATVAVEDMFGVLVVARLVGKLTHGGRAVQDMYVAIKTDADIHVLEYNFFTASAGVLGSSVGANPNSYQRVGDAMQDGTYKGEPENPFQHVGKPKAIILAQHAASVLLHGDFNLDVTQAYGTEEHIAARGLDPDALYRVSMVDSWAAPEEPAVE